MEILKECHCLYQYYYETWNSYLNVCLLKIVVLLSNRENYLQTIFLRKGIVYLLFYFLSQHFLYDHFHSHVKEYCAQFLYFFPWQINFFCILCKRSIVLLWSLVISIRCINLETAKDLKTVILPSKVICLMCYNFKILLIWQYVCKCFYVAQYFYYTKNEHQVFPWFHY